jgi:hypothetical protein
LIPQGLFRKILMNKRLWPPFQGFAPQSVQFPGEGVAPARLVGRSGAVKIAVSARGSGEHPCQSEINVAI